MPAVTFDLWHTLIYLEPDAEERYMRDQVRAARDSLASFSRLPGSPDLSVEELGHVYERVLRRAVDAAGEGRTVTPAEQIVEAAHEVGREPRPEAYLDRLEREVRATRFRRAPGADGVLRTLSEEGYRLAIISNTVGEPGEFIRPVLREMGLDRYVGAVIFSDEHPWTKPSPEIFQAALDAIGEVPKRAVHVGDGWSDIEGARRARLKGAVLYTGLQRYGARYKSLFLPSGWDQPDADYRVAHLDEIPGVVREILPARESR